jgi:hypothetical protein
MIFSLMLTRVVNLIIDQCNHRKDVTRVVSLIPAVHLELQISSRILINDIDTTRVNGGASGKMIRAKN